MNTYLFIFWAISIFLLIIYLVYFLRNEIANLLHINKKNSFSITERHFEKNDIEKTWSQIDITLKDNTLMEHDWNFLLMQECARNEIIENKIKILLEIGEKKGFIKKPHEGLSLPSIYVYEPNIMKNKNIIKLMDDISHIAELNTLASNTKINEDHRNHPQ